jgi:hypothetical protein
MESGERGGTRGPEEHVDGDRLRCSKFNSEG